MRRWLVMMLLTGRASGSFETGFERDLSRIARHGAKAALQEIEQSELTDAFWDFGLPQRLESSSINNPQFRSFLASQVKAKAQAFLSKHSSVHDMIEIQGDIHHLVPKDYLRKNGVNDKREYNQVANYAMTETAVNIRIGNRLPADYLDEVKAQIRSGQTTLGEITTEADLDKSFEENAVPASLFETTVENFEGFLIERRRLMAKKMKEYYFSL